MPLIDDLLVSSHVTGGEFDCTEMDISAIARSAATRLVRAAPDRRST